MYRCHKCGRWVRPWADLAALCRSDRPWAERNELCGPCFDPGQYTAWNDLTRDDQRCIERAERREQEAL